jgi:hypothetical protein
MAGAAGKCKQELEAAGPGISRFPFPHGDGRHSIAINSREHLHTSRWQAHYVRDY